MKKLSPELQGCLRKFEDYHYDNDGVWSLYNTLEDGDSVSYGDIKHDTNGQFLEVPYSTWSDYSGDTVNRANYEYMLDNYKDHPYFHEIYGGYNTSGILLDVRIFDDSEIGDDLLEKIEGLLNYPLFNDEYLSDLEMRLSKESWDGWVKYDLKRALDAAEIEYPEDDKELESLFWHCVSYNQFDFTFDDAVSAYIDIDKIVENWLKGFCPSCGGELNYQGQKCDICYSLFDYKNLPTLFEKITKFFVNLWAKITKA